MNIEVLTGNVMSNPEKITDTFLITKRFKTPSEFSYHIETTAAKTKNSCMDILIEFCISNEIEAESINKLINSSLKEKLESEAQDLNLLKVKSKSIKLPF